MSRIVLRNDLISLLAERDNDAVTVSVGGIQIDVCSTVDQRRAASRPRQIGPTAAQAGPRRSAPAGSHNWTTLPSGSRRVANRPLA